VRLDDGVARLGHRLAQLDGGGAEGSHDAAGGGKGRAGVGAEGDGQAGVQRIRRGFVHRAVKVGSVGHGQDSTGSEQIGSYLWFTRLSVFAPEF
jgi:hypothetical protein